jgi:hypothetical protein
MGEREEEGEREREEEGRFHHRPLIQLAALHKHKTKRKYCAGTPSR